MEGVRITVMNKTNRDAQQAELLKEGETTTMMNQKIRFAPTGNRTQGKCLEGIYVTTTPSALAVLMLFGRFSLHYIK